MFIFGVLLTIGWIFCFFYYGDALPRNAQVGGLIAGIFSMGYGLLKRRR